MNDILFELLKLIVMIAVLLVMRYAIPWLRARIGAEKITEIEKWAEKAGENFKYFMVFENKNVEGCYTAKIFLEIIRAL